MQCPPTNAVFPSINRILRWSRWFKTPMKRTNPAKGRGIDPKFVPISWDEALNTVADKMIELRKSGETHKLVYLRGRYSSTSTALL